MGRQTWRFGQLDRERKERQTRVRPGWLITGCVLPLLLGGAGYLVAAWFLRANAENKWIYIPPQLMHPGFAPWLGDGVLVQIIVGVIFIFTAFVVLTVIYSILFPPERGETDVPPLRKRPSRRR